MHQLHELPDDEVASESPPELSEIPGCPHASATNNDGGSPAKTLPLTDEKPPPDHSVPFYQLHPHAYNLHWCMRTPLDADSEAFVAFLERQAMSRSTMNSMATKYAQVALANPHDTKVLKIATELTSAAFREQLAAGEQAAAQESAQYLQALLDLLPASDDPTDRENWQESLTKFQSSFSERQEEMEDEE